MVYKFFDKKTAGSGIKSMPQNERPLDLAMHQLAEELHKFINQLLENFKKEKYIQHSKTILGVVI